MEVKRFDEETMLVFSPDDVVSLQGNTLRSSLHGEDDTDYQRGMLDAFESFLLALHVQGFDFDKPSLKTAVEETVQAIANHMDD